MEGNVSFSRHTQGHRIWLNVITEILFFFLDNATKFVNPWLRNYYINIKDIILTG